MNAFLERMAAGERIIAVTGHFGSGKTEFAVSLAFALAALEREERLALADLDIENPFFRSRERQDALEAVGVKVYSDPFHGDASGAMILNQFKKYFAPGQYRLLCVVNPNRPGSDTADKAVAHIRGIEQTTGLRVTGLVSNAHLIYETTAEDVLRGWDFTSEVAAKSGVPALCACCMKSLVPRLEGHGFTVFPIGMYMRDSYLDKKV